jgi:hypothetical protein
MSLLTLRHSDGPHCGEMAASTTTCGARTGPTSSIESDLVEAIVATNHGPHNLGYGEADEDLVLLQ